MYDRSGSITLGGTAQQLMPARTRDQGTRKGWLIQNMSAGDLYVRFDGATAAAAVGSVLVPPAYQFTCPSWLLTNDAISIYGASTGQAFTALEN